MRRLILTLAGIGLAFPMTPVAADPPRHAHGHHSNSRYDNQGRYTEPRAMGRNDEVWRGHDGRYHCKRDNGTTGLVVGAAVGGLLGNRIAGDGNRTLGTLIGAAGGGLLGRSVDRGEVRCR